MHPEVPVRFGRGRLDSLGNKGLAAYLMRWRTRLRSVGEVTDARNVPVLEVVLARGRVVQMPGLRCRALRQLLAIGRQRWPASARAERRVTAAAPVSESRATYPFRPALPYRRTHAAIVGNQ